MAMERHCQGFLQPRRSLANTWIRATNLAKKGQDLRQPKVSDKNAETLALFASGKDSPALSNLSWLIYSKFVCCWMIQAILGE